MSLSCTFTESSTIFLSPRPLARSPGSFILLPLLPRPRPVKPLPAEVWSKVLSYVVHDGEDNPMGVPERHALLREKWKLLFVCKSWAVSTVSFDVQKNRMVVIDQCTLTAALEESLFFHHVFDFYSSYVARTSFFLCSILACIFSLFPHSKSLFPTYAPRINAGTPSDASHTPPPGAGCRCWTFLR